MKYDLAELYCQLCSLQMTSPQMMQSHMAGKAHNKKVAAANQENASALATSLIQSVREEAKLDAEMPSVVPAESPTKEKKPLEVQEQPQQIQAIRVPQVATTAPAASPGRSS